jgi:hypothetical protein
MRMSLVPMAKSSPAAEASIAYIVSGATYVKGPKARGPEKN